MSTLLYSLYNFFTEFGRIKYKIWSGILWWDYLRILPQYSFIWEDSVIFNIWAASNSEIRVFFPSIYSPELSDTINLHLGLLHSHPENPGGREMMCMAHLHSAGTPSTEAACTGSTPVRLLVQLLAMGWPIPPKWATLPWRKGGQQGNEALQLS